MPCTATTSPLRAAEFRSALYTVTPAHMKGPASAAGNSSGIDASRRWRNHILGISAVKIDARNLAIDAHSEIAAPALFADKIMSAVPADADALAFFPFCNPVADCIDAPGDLMTGHTRILKSGPQTFFNENVAVTNAARFYFHANLPSTRLRDVAFHQFPISTGLANLCCFHFLIHKMPLLLIRAVLAFAFST